MYYEIDKILWNDWDPLGVNDIAPGDEYKSYTPVLCSLKINEADKETITLKLFDIETKIMGLSGNFEHCRFIANKIYDLKCN